MLAVVLAAGEGTRMAPLTQRCPKSLLPVAGRPLITCILRILAYSGIKRVIVVDGHQGERIRRALGDGGDYEVRITYVHSGHTGKGNALSLYAARNAVENRPFLLMMGDHLISPALVRHMLRPLWHHNTLCVDRDARWARPGEATLVWVRPDGRITHIGKGLSRYNGVDTGLFWLTPVVFRAIEAMQDATSGPPTISETMEWLIKRGPGLWARQVSNAEWVDVDTPEDLQRAEQWLQQHSDLIGRTRETRR
jgi:NDP-sugar pyrophosphorylase family protein